MNRTRVTTAAVALGGLLVTGAAVVLLAGPAQAKLTTNTADCTANVVVTGSSGAKVTATEKTDRITIDPKSSYVGTGSVYGGQGTGKRSNEGAVKIDLPAPFPDYGPGDWSWSNKDSDTYASTDPKSGSFDIPGWVPRGFYVPLVAAHDEKGKEVCTYEGEIKINGGFADSPVSLGAVAGAILFLLLTMLAGVKKGA